MSAGPYRLDLRHEGEHVHAYLAPSLHAEAHIAVASVAHGAFHCNPTFQEQFLLLAHRACEALARGVRVVAVLKKVETIAWAVDGSLPSTFETVLVSARGVPVDLGWWDGEAWRWNESGGFIEQPVVGWARRPKGVAETLS